MKRSFLSLAVTLVFAFVCAVLLTVAASATAVYVSTLGDDSCDGLTASNAVQTFAHAHDLAAADASIDTIYVIGSVTHTQTSNFYLGVPGRSLSILGYSDSPALSFTGNGSTVLAGDVIIDDLKYTSRGTIYTKTFDLTLGSGVVGTNFNSTTIAAAYNGTTNGSFETPTVITVDAQYSSTAARAIKELTPVASANAVTKYNGWIRFNLSSGSRIQTSFYGVNGTNSAQKSAEMNGIVELNTEPGSAIVSISMNPYGSTSKDVYGTIISRGLRNFHLNGTATTVYLAGSLAKTASTGAANPDSTGVAVWTFGSASSTQNFKQNGIENETNVTHVLIFNNRDLLYDRYTTARNSWGVTVPNEYVFQVDATGSVEAYMSKLPTSETDLECTLGGIQLISTHSHAIIDAGTANEQAYSPTGLR